VHIAESQHIARFTTRRALGAVVSTLARDCSGRANKRETILTYLGFPGLRFGFL